LYRRGDALTDRTAGPGAIADFDRFYDAGVTSVATADVFGGYRRITLPSHRPAKIYFNQSAPAQKCQP
jgi:hypothetical protein